MKSIILVFFFLFTTSFSQDYGVIYSALKANEIYGEVDQSFQISKAILDTTLNSSENIVMFKFINEECYVFDNSKNVLLGSNHSVEKPAQFYVFSINKIMELLKLGGSNTVHLEMRENVFTVTVGEYTLEDAMWCPPFCD